MTKNEKMTALGIQTDTKRRRNCKNDLQIGLAQLLLPTKHQILKTIKTHKTWLTL